MCDWIANDDYSGRWHVERKIQLQHVYPRFPKKPELATFGVLHDQPFHRSFLQTSCAGDTPHLERRRGAADVRVESASRGSHEIHGDRIVIARIRCSQSGNSPFDGLVQCRIGRPEVRPTGGSRIVRKRRGRRGTTPKILWLIEVLSNELGSDDLFIANNQAAVGLMWEKQLSQTCDREWIHHASAQGKDRQQRQRGS